MRTFLLAILTSSETELAENDGNTDETDIEFGEELNDEWG
jgi:hypothetical protein